MSGEFERCLPEWTVVTQDIGETALNKGTITPLWQDHAGQLVLTRIGTPAQSHYCLRFANLIKVDVLFPDRMIIERPLREDVTRPTREHFLVDQVLPRILGHQGKLVLHAAAVRNGDGAFLLLGKSGSGKSSLAASFDRAGFSLLGDDALVVSWRGDSPLAQAVYPSLRLFPDSIHALGLQDAQTASVAHYTPKLRISVPIKDGGESGALPIRALFMIGARSPNLEILVQPKSIADACMALVENSFVLDPTDKARAPGRLEQASRLAREVPAFDLCYPRAYSRLADVQAAILAALDQAA